MAKMGFRKRKRTRLSADGTETEKAVYRFKFGRHKGEKMTHVPVGYLRWMVNANHEHANLAEEEIVRRGHEVPDIELSPHSINRFSERFLDRFRKREDEKVGIYNFLLHLAQEALASCDNDLEEKIRLDGITFIFTRDTKWPVLKTVQ